MAKGIMNYKRSITGKFIMYTLTCVFCFQSQSTQAQFWKRLKEKVVEKVEEKITDKTVEETEKEMDKILNKKKDKKASEKKTSKKQPASQRPNSEETENKENSKNKIVENRSLEMYRNFKFISGEKIIFYDDLQYEEVGEFPSRWDLMHGSVEVAKINNEKVILFINEYDNYINPLFKNENYLGDEFTIEFDFFINKSDEHLGRSIINLMFEKEYVSNQNTNIEINVSNSEGVIDGSLKGFDLEKIKIDGFNKWHHLSLSYYKGKLKLYINEHRVLNLPRFKDKIEIFAFSLSSYNKERILGVKNIRIAHGGGQMYKRIMADGKYITNGILFDSGKATIKPQSMGIINKMVAVMKEKADWNFEIIGHTDSDGDANKNLTLSKQRAEKVKEAIVNQGISANRLTTKGKGETEPLNTNSNKEQKANNRRVEFIKK